MVDDNAKHDDDTHSIGGVEESVIDAEGVKPTFGTLVKLNGKGSSPRRPRLDVATQPSEAQKSHDSETAQSHQLDLSRLATALPAPRYPAYHPDPRQAHWQHVAGEVTNAAHHQYRSAQQFSVQQNYPSIHNPQHLYTQSRPIEGFAPAYTGFQLAYGHTHGMGQPYPQVFQGFQPQAQMIYGQSAEYYTPTPYFYGRAFEIAPGAMLGQIGATVARQQIASGGMILAVSESHHRVSIC
jgi:hypothetical protein